MLSRGTSSVEEIRALMSEAASAGCTPHVPAYNALLSRMQLEGRPVADLGAVLEEMRGNGLEADEHTRRILAYNEPTLSAMRTSELRRRLQQSEGGSTRARLAAWQLFAGLVERGQLDTFQLNAMRRLAAQAAWLARTEAAADEQRNLDTFRRAEELLRISSEGAPSVSQS